MVRLTTAPAGKWSSNAERLVPRGTLTWHDVAGGLHGSVATVDRQQVAVVRKVQGGYMLRIEGWQWTVTPDMGAARLNAIPGDKITHTPAKFFATRQDAKREAEAILRPPSKAAPPI